MLVNVAQAWCSKQPEAIYILDHENCKWNFTEF